MSSLDERASKWLGQKVQAEGSLYIFVAILTDLAALGRLSPIPKFCEVTGLFLRACIRVNTGLENIWPFYVIVAFVALPVLMFWIVQFFRSLNPQNAFLEFIPIRLRVAIILVFITSIIFLFASLHRWVGIVRPDYPDSKMQITHELGECLYFSVITITTVGYGDYHPANLVLSRFIAGAEAISGFIVLGLLVSSFFNITISSSRS